MLGGEADDIGPYDHNHFDRGMTDRIEYSPEGGMGGIGGLSLDGMSGMGLGSINEYGGHGRMNPMDVLGIAGLDTEAYADRMMNGPNTHS
jgi:hypothetical protein